jgi:hypothetical protein
MRQDTLLFFFFEALIFLLGFSSFFFYFAESLSPAIMELNMEASVLRFGFLRDPVLLLWTMTRAS